MKIKAVLCLSILGLSSAFAAEDDPRIRLEKAKAANTEYALNEFLLTSPPRALEAEARLAICVLRTPKPDDSSTPPANKDVALTRMATLQVRYLFANACGHERAVHASLLKSFREYAEAAGIADQHQKNFEQSADASISRVAKMLRTSTLQRLENTLRPTALKIALDKKYPLKLRFAKLDMFVAYRDASLSFSFFDAVFSLGVVTTDTSKMKVVAPADSTGKIPTFSVESSKLLIKRGTSTATGAYLVNDKQIHCWEGGVSFDSLDAEPLFTAGTRCLFGEKEVVYRGGRWQ